MSIGNDLLPNVYINNIEIHEKKIKYDIFVLDNDIEPTWSKKKSIQNSLMLKHIVVTDAVEKDSIARGNLSFNKFSKNTTISLVSRMPSENVDAVANLENHRCFIKTFEFTLPNQIENITIFANLFIEGVSEEGPIMSEDIFINGQLNDTTNILLRDGIQYYGSVHLHENRYMEGKKHTTRPHKTVEQVSIPNLKIKDFRPQSLPLRSMQTYSPVPVFSNLYDSFDEETNHNFMFFINLRQIIENRTKYGKFLANAHEFTRRKVFNQLTFRTINIKKYKLSNNINNTLNNEQYLKIEHLLSGFEGGREGYTSISGEPMEFISHNYGEDIRGIKFYDSGANDGSFGRYQYEIEFSFADNTIGIVSELISKMKFNINLVQDFQDFISRPNKYKEKIKKITKEAELSTYVTNNLHESAARSLNKIKLYLYEMTEEDRQKDLIRIYNLINPKTCTLQSLSVFIDESKLLLEKLVSVLDLNFSPVKANYQSAFLPNSVDFSNRVVVQHKFKHIITPSNSKVHVTYSKEKPTAENFNETTSDSPVGVKSRTQTAFFGTGETSIVNNILLGSILNNIPTPSVSVFEVSNTPPKETERYINSSDFLGDDTKFNSFTTNEKCEIKEEAPVVKDSVEMVVTTEVSNPEEEMQKAKIEIEKLSGFRETESGRLILTEPIWDLHEGSDIVGTTIIKQKRVGDVDPLLNLPFANKYLLLNNLGTFKGKLVLDNDINLLNQLTAQYKPYNSIFTQSVIVQNYESPQGDDLPISPAPNRVDVTPAQNQAQPAPASTGVSTTSAPMTTSSPMTTSTPTTTSTSGGGY
jgi:hypothetical protein